MRLNHYDHNDDWVYSNRETEKKTVSSAIKTSIVVIAIVTCVFSAVNKVVTPLIRMVSDLRQETVSYQQQPGTAPDTIVINGVEYQAVADGKTNVNMESVSDSQISSPDGDGLPTEQSGDAHESQATATDEISNDAADRNTAVTVPDTKISDNTGTSEEKTVGTPGLEYTGDYLMNLVTVPGNKFGSLFKVKGKVIDYRGVDLMQKEGNERPIFIVYADGLADGAYSHPVTFLNEGYSTLSGHLILPDDEYTIEAVKTGYITLVLLDDRNNIIGDYKQYDKLDSKTRETSFDLDISGMDEFTLAVDCTDGRAGGEKMYMIVEDLELKK